VTLKRRAAALISVEVLDEEFIEELCRIAGWLDLQGSVVRARYVMTAARRLEAWIGSEERGRLLDQALAGAPAPRRKGGKSARPAKRPRGK
jgi:hypothetical protein